MPYEPPPQRPYFNPPRTRVTPRLIMTSVMQDRPGSSLTLSSSHRTTHHRSSSFIRRSSRRGRSVIGYVTLSWAWPGSLS
jgi:hypothetical protein